MNSEILLALSRSPLNEDVFAPRSKETSSVEKEIRELQGQIYKLLLQVKKAKEFQNMGWPSEWEAKETWVWLVGCYEDGLLKDLKGKFYMDRTQAHLITKKKSLLDIFAKSLCWKVNLHLETVWSMVENSL